MKLAFQQELKAWGKGAKQSREDLTLKQQF